MSMDTRPTGRRRQMTSRERIAAALSFQAVDQVPYSIWTHYPGWDLKPDKLAELQVRDALRYDFDFIKIANNGLFSVIDYGTRYDMMADGEPVTDKYGTLCPTSFGITDSSQWRALTVLNPQQGHLGEQLQVVAGIKTGLKKAGREDIPVIPTIYSPLTTAAKLAGPELLLADLAARPAEIHQVLQILTETTASFARAAVNVGADGFFFATQLANRNKLAEPTYDEFGEQYDRQVFDAFIQSTFFNVIHIHGEGAMFEKLAAYPAQCISWHDRWIGPSLAEARSVTSKCLLGGIDEERAFGVIPDAEFRQHVREGLALGGQTGFILGPGCTAYPNMPEGHLQIIQEELAMAAQS